MAHRAPQQLIRLLATSKAMHAAIGQHCAGLLPVAFRPKSHQQVESFGAWLPEHAQLITSLQLRKLPKYSPDAAGMTEASREALDQAAEVQVAAALQAHKQQQQRQEGDRVPQQLRPGLSVKKFNSEFVGSAVGGILDALPSALMLSIVLGGHPNKAHLGGALRASNSRNSSSSVSLAAFRQLRVLVLNVEAQLLQPMVP